MTLKTRDFLTLHDFTRQELEQIIEISEILKKERSTGGYSQLLKGKLLLQLYQKASTRTRASFKGAMWELGGDADYWKVEETQAGRGETWFDTGKILSGYGYSSVMARLYKHSDLEELAKGSDIPVINGLTDKFHPCQTLGDVLTIKEVKGRIEGLKVAFVGDCYFNMANTTLIGCTMLGMNVVLVCPNKEKYQPSREIMKIAKEKAGGKIEIMHDPKEGVKDVDIVMTDVFVSMGQESETQERINDLSPYQVNTQLMKHAKKDAIFMHCLPSNHTSENTADKELLKKCEVTDEVFFSKKSVIWQQAYNRMHIQKGILTAILLGGLPG